MALDLDLYDWVFQFLGVTNLSGDPVRDAMYKLLLPMVVLFLFIRKVIGDSRFGGTGTELIMSFITGFIIIYEGYFPISETQKHGRPEWRQHKGFGLRISSFPRSRVGTGPNDAPKRIRVRSTHLTN